MAEIKDRPKKWTFTFDSEELGEYVFKYNPKEWASTEYSIERNDDDGMIFVFSGEYTYLKDAYDYLNSGLATYGVLWNVTLKLEYYDNFSFQDEVAYENRKLDFSSITKSAEDGNVYKIPLTDSGFYEKIKARENKLIPYSRLTTLDGKVIDPFVNEYENVTVFGQEIISENVLTIQGTTDSAKIIFPSISNSSIDPAWISTVINGGFGIGVDFLAPSQEFVNERMFFNPLRRSGNLTGSITIKYTAAPSGATQRFALLDYKELLPIQVFSDTDFYTSGTATFSFDVDYDFDGDTRLVLYCGSSGSIATIEETIHDFKVTDKRDPDIIQHVSFFQAFTRVIESMTGQPNSFVSSTLESGEWSHLYLSNGYLYRQFPADATVPAVENEVAAQLSFKYKELKEFCERNIGLKFSMETIGGIRKIVCEDDDYFYSSEVGLVIDKIEKDSLNIKTDIDLYYSGILTGSPKKDYELQGVLLSYSTPADYTTRIDIIDNPLDLQTTYQIDGNWAETTRRLNISETETTDSPYDNDIFVLETTRYILNLFQKTIQGFDTISGIDDITTPCNLDLTPARTIYRKGKWIRVGLEKNLGQTLTLDAGFGPATSFYPTYIKFNTSDILTKLSTLKSDESVQVYENQDIDPNNLDPSIFTGDIAECLADIDIWQVTAFEQNPYRRIQIPNEIDGGVIQGWLKSLSTKPLGDATTNVAIYVARDIIAIDNSIGWTDRTSIDWTDGESIDWV